jgi:hypothetical protein
MTDKLLLKVTSIALVRTEMLFCKLLIQHLEAGAKMKPVE